MKKNYFLSVLLIVSQFSQAQKFKVESPGKEITVNINNEDELTYSVQFKDKLVIQPSALGFELKNEPAMADSFEVIRKSSRTINETWFPVVKSKHAEIINHFNEIHLFLTEKKAPRRNMELIVRAFDDGIAFQYKLFRSANPGERQITKELTTFHLSGDPKSWVAEYKGGYASSNESEYFERKLSYIQENTIAGLPLLMEMGENCWMAITEARIDNYAGFYLGTNGTAGQLITKLVPLPGEEENGIKVRFTDDLCTPWRVIMLGDSPGVLIESEIIQNLNDPCAIEDPSWIRPGLSAWDHWWSADVKMEMPVIKEYIDMASAMGWPYMLIDWQWYGKFNLPESDITKWAPQINIPEIIEYAAGKNVRIILWLYSSDVNKNSAFKTAFPLYKKWGIAGVKIDFMNRDDQQMVNWYHEIVRCAAENHLLVDFHGAYKPDGMIRTWPNLLTREGVMGNEYYKFSEKMNPEHNVKLAFTRMLAGQMDYTPGGFLNVTKEQFVNRHKPTLVWNTRSAELAKFVVYESPLTVVCDHPVNILNKPGAEFLKVVPTTWDDTRFIGGYPGEYIALARRSGDVWFLGIINNSISKEIEIKTSFLPEGDYEIESFSDTNLSEQDPKDVRIGTERIYGGKILKVSLATNGGYAAIIRKR
ncbi:MAG: glycoside hydrolase family 97 protein [Mangrovibacterium sp.]